MAPRRLGAARGVDRAIGRLRRGDLVGLLHRTRTAQVGNAGMCLVDMAV